MIYKSIFVLFFLLNVVYPQNQNPSIPIYRDFADSTSSPKGQSPAGLARQRIVFENLTVDDGLSSRSILSILQDNRGFIWIGTRGGLVKYNGDSFKFISSGPDSISGNHIVCIMEDSDGHIWLGINGIGIDKFGRINWPAITIFTPVPGRR